MNRLEAAMRHAEEQGLSSFIYTTKKGEQFVYFYKRGKWRNAGPQKHQLWSEPREVEVFDMEPTESRQAREEQNRRYLEEARRWWEVGG